MLVRADGAGGVAMRVGDFGGEAPTRFGDLGDEVPTRLGELGAGGTTSTSELRSEVEYLGLCLPRMWSFRVSFRE